MSLVKDAKRFPWKNGYWCNKKEKCTLAIIDEDRIEFHNTVCLDYPELKLKPEFQRNLIFGDFGPAPKDLVELTGIRNYNMRLPNAGPNENFNIDMILNEEGTQISRMSLSPEEKFKVIDWLSHEDLEALKESREFADAPICPYFKPQVKIYVISCFTRKYSIKVIYRYFSSLNSLIMLEDLFGFLDLQEQEKQQLLNSLEEIMDIFIMKEIVGQIM